VIALIWSKTVPGPNKVLEARIETLEAKLAALQGAGEGGE
jgi:hypothetical protein